MQTDSFTKKEVYQFVTSDDPSLIDGNSSRYINKKIVDVLSSLGYREKVVKRNGKAVRLMINDDEIADDSTIDDIFNELPKE